LFRVLSRVSRAAKNDARRTLFSRYLKRIHYIAGLISFFEFFETLAVRFPHSVFTQVEIGRVLKGRLSARRSAPRARDRSFQDERCQRGCRKSASRIFEMNTPIFYAKEQVGT
jgi:hypothetical protein